MINNESNSIKKFINKQLSQYDEFEPTKIQYNGLTIYDHVVYTEKLSAYKHRTNVD